MPVISVNVDARDALGRFERMPKRIHDNLLLAMTSAMDSLRDYVRGTKLSGQVLQERSGKLKESITTSILDKGNFIKGSVFSDGSVPYANAQEYGADIFPVNKQALVFHIDGKTIFSQHVHLPERSYLRSSAEETKDGIIELLRGAVADGVLEP